MFWNCIIFYISSQFFFTSGLTLPSSSTAANSTEAQFNCGDTEVNLYYSSLVSGTGLEVSSAAECRAECRGREGCTAWSWLSSLRCFTGKEAGASVASSGAISGTQNCKFPCFSSPHSEAHFYHSTGKCTDNEEDRRFSYSSPETEYPNVGPYQCRLLCMRTPECEAWTSKGRTKCVLLREETGKQEAPDWSLGTKTCGSNTFDKYKHLIYCIIFSVL